MQPTGWNISNQVVIISSSDTAWGGGGNPSGGKYLGIQGISYIEQTLVPNIKGYRLSFFARSRPGYSPSSLEITYCERVIHTLNSMISIWTSHTVFIPPICSSNSNKLVFKQTNTNGDVAVHLDNIVASVWALDSVCGSNTYYSFSTSS
jgi:hypothetical protein